MSESVVHTHDLGKCYKLYTRPLDRLKEFFSTQRNRYHKDFWALQSVSFSVHPGESWGIIGRNGAGKSTLLKLIAGVTRPSTGELTVAGRIGALLELGTGFHPEYTGRENIYFAAAVLGLERDETETVVPAILDFADLAEFIDRPVKTYSSGMFMRLGFAVATSIRPDILITDEVLAVGDEAFQKKCIRRMEAFLEQGKSLLFCSHSTYHVRKLCQKALWLDHGKVRALGEAAEVANAYEDYLRDIDARAMQAQETVGQSADSTVHSRLRAVRLYNSQNEETASFAMGDTTRLEIIAETPDGVAPIIGVGLVRNDKTAIYGIFSDIDRVEPEQIEERTFRIVYELYDLSLLPGSYTFRAHVLDPPALRMFDTVEKDFLVRGDTREMGVCRVPHRWRFE